MLRKPAILLSFGVVPKNYCSHCSSPYSDFNSSRRRSFRSSNQRDQRCARNQCDTRAPQDNGDFAWPQQSSTTTSPTPYEILRLKKGAPYSKNRFYELVKIYHPDRHTHGKPMNGHEPSHATKLERYRLIVAANDILSDPAKRSAYDRCGAGWDGFRESYTWNSEKSRKTRWSGFEDNESIFRNATWEDWEKWHSRKNRHRPEPIYMENRSFFALIAFVTALALASQMSKAGRASQTFLDQVGARHDTSSKNLQHSRFGHYGGFPDRDQRIRKFLYNREQYDPGGIDPIEDDSPRLTSRIEIPGRPVG